MEYLIQVALQRIKLLQAAFAGIEGSLAQLRVLIANIATGGGGAATGGNTQYAGNPNGNVIGGPGASQYLICINTSTGEMYHFVGTAGATSPWIV